MSGAPDKDPYGWGTLTTTLQPPPAPRPEETPAEDDPYGFGRAATTQGNAQQAVVNAHAANPDTAAQAQTLAPRVGMAPAVIEQNLPAAKAQAQTQHNLGVVARSKPLAEWVAKDQVNARLANDDFDNLDFMSKMLTAIGSGEASGFDQNALGRLYTQKQIGALTGIATPQTDKQIADLEAMEGRKPTIGGFMGGLQWASTQGAALLDNFYHGAQFGIGTAAVGAAAGAVSTPEVGGAGALPGAAAGFTFGTATGFAADMGQVAAGQFYKQSLEMRDKNGQPLPESTRQIAALLVGVGTAALGGVGTHVVGGALHEAASRFLGDAVTEAVTRPTVARALAKAGLDVAKGGIEGAVIMGGMEATNVAAEEFAKQLSIATNGQDWDTLFNDPTTRQQALERVGNAAEIGALSIGAVHLLPGLAEFAGGAMRARAANSYVEGFQALEQGAVDSKLRERSPDKFMDYLTDQADGSPVENLHISGEAVRQLYQSLNVTPADGDALLGKVTPDIVEQMQQAQQTGGDIVVKTSDYLTHLAGSDASKALMPDIRVRPDAWTAREAAAFEEQKPEMVTKLGEQMRSTMEAGSTSEAEHQAIAAPMVARLEAAGFAPEQATKYAALTASRYMVRAERTGKGSLDLFHREGPLVERGEDVPGGAGRKLHQTAAEAIRDQKKNATLDLTPDMEIVRAYHGTPHGFDKFDIGKIGTGEGHQAYGHGLYFAEKESTAQWYRDVLSRSRAGRSVFLREGAGRRQIEPPNALHNEFELKPEELSAKYLANHASAQDALDDLKHRALEAKVDKEHFFNEKSIFKTPNREDRAYKKERYDRATRTLSAYTDAVKWLTKNKENIEFDNAKPGSMFEVALTARRDEFLDWDKPIKEQSPYVRERIESAIAKIGDGRAPEREALQAAVRSGDMSGEALYSHLKNVLTRDGAARDERQASVVSDELRKVGVKGIRYRDQGSRLLDGKDNVTHNFVMFHDADIDIIRRYQENRGMITLADSQAMITLFKDADFSTFLHESGHMWLEELKRDALEDDAPQQIRDDFAKVMDYLGVDENQEDITTEQHEKFARTVEAFFMEGKAPSAALERVFRAFKDWLTRIYRTLAALDAPINDDIRGVLSRMIATDAELEAARQRDALVPDFASAKDAGMTNAEFAAYLKGIDKARGNANERMLAKTMAVIRRARTDAWKTDAAEMRSKVAEEIHARDDLKAWTWMATGKMLDDPDAPAGEKRVRLDRDKINEMYNYDTAADQMPQGTTTAKGGADPEELCTLLGYKSGYGLTKDLTQLEQQRLADEKASGKPMGRDKFIAHMIDSETTRRMQEKHGDLLSDASIAEEATRAIHNDAQAAVMATEMKAIARQAGVQSLRMEDIKRWAHDEIEATPVNRAKNTGTWTRAEAKAGREVQRALLKGKHAEAFEAKQRQLINHLLAIESQEAADDYDRASKLFVRYAARLPKGGPEPYLDRIQEILKRMDYKTRRSDAELARALQGESLDTFRDRELSNGREPVIADFLFDSSWRKSLDDMDVEEMRAAMDTINSLAHYARDELAVRDGERRAMIADLATEVEAQTADMPRLPASRQLNPKDIPGIRGAFEKMKSELRGVGAAALKMETVFDKLDGRQSDGVFNRVIFRRLKEAQHWENDKLADVSGKLRALGEEVSKTEKRWQKKLDKRYDVQELREPRSGDSRILTHKDVISIALNMGNESNFDKMARGEKVSQDALRAIVDRHLSAADWHFVQGVWDIFESLYPDIESMTRRTTGVGSEKIEAKALTTKFGELRGGYFPVIYDPLRSHRAELHQQRAASTQLMENNYQRATTPKGHTKTRVDSYAAPIRLQAFDVIPWKLRQAIHDLAFREAIVDADRFLRNERVRDVINETMGREYSLQMGQWLQSIANETNIDDKALAGIDKLLRCARVNTTIVGIGFRVSTMFKHGTTALFNSIGELGPTWMMRGVAEAYGTPWHWAKSVKFVLEQSGEMRNRMNSIDRDTRENMRMIEGTHGLKSAVVHYSHFGVAMLDMGSAIPTWLGAYRKALSEGKANDDAIYYADKTVRNAHGAQGVTDLAQIQRGTELTKWFTMFYGFFNHILNRQIDTVWRAKEGASKLAGGDLTGARRDFGVVLMRSMYYVVVPALVEAMAQTGGPDQDKDESWWAWAGKAILGELPAGIPVLRDIAKAALENKEDQLSPVGGMITALINSKKDLEAWAGGDQVSDRWVQHAIQTPGYIFGLPTGQASGTAQYLWDLSDGTETPDDEIDFLRGLAFGPKPKKDRNK